MECKVKRKLDWKFRDQSFPARIWMFVRDRTLDGIDLLLMSVIADLTKPHESEERPGEGCFASNRRLGEAVNLHSINISKRIKALAKDKLLLIFQANGRRYVELEWSRTGEERLALTGEYGRAYRKAYQKQMGVKLIAPLAEALSPLSGSAKPPLSGSAKHINKETVDKERCRPTDNNGFGVSLNCTGNDHKCATYLHQALIRHNKVMRRVSISAWSREFLRLSQSVEWSRIKKVLDWYCENIGGDFIPACYSASSFCEKFPKLEDAMRRERATKAKEEPSVW